MFYDALRTTGAPASCDAKPGATVRMGQRPDAVDMDGDAESWLATGVGGSDSALTVTSIDQIALTGRREGESCSGMCLDVRILQWIPGSPYKSFSDDSLVVSSPAPNVAAHSPEFVGPSQP